MNVRRGLSRPEGQDVVTRLQANCTARSGLIQESVGADVRRLCFIGILKVSLLTSAPTLALYLESALRARSARSARSLGIDISARGVLLVKSETGQWGRIFPTRIWGQVNTWYLPNPDMGQASCLRAKAPPFTEALHGESLSPVVTGLMILNANFSTDEFCPETNVPTAVPYSRLTS